MQILEATADELSQAEAHILPAFQKSLEDLLRERKDPRPQVSDDRAIFGLADKAVRDYHAATARSSSLPQLSQVPTLGDTAATLHPAQRARTAGRAARQGRC